MNYIPCTCKYEPEGGHGDRRIPDPHCPEHTSTADALAEMRLAHAKRAEQAARLSHGTTNWAYRQPFPLAKD